MGLGRTLLNNDAYELRVGLFGGATVVVKHFDRTVSALKEEARFLLDLASELEKRGVPITPGSNLFEEACEEFCNAVASRPNAAWKAYFRYPPSYHADEIAGGLNAGKRPGENH